jgi:hypothetical protein
LRAVRILLNSSDFSTLLRAQSSKAKIIGLADAGLETTNSIERAAEFGIARIDANLLRRVVLATARRFAANSARRNDLDVRPSRGGTCGLSPRIFTGGNKLGSGRRMGMIVLPGCRPEESGDPLVQGTRRRT